ncbi:MAG: ABC transporter substrate-binding protein, partial [Promethearchaeota archaeon]
MLGSLLVGCGQPSSTQTSQTPDAETQTSQTPDAETPTADITEDISQRGGTLRIISMADVNSLGVPTKMMSPEDGIQCRPALETLARYDDQGLAVPYLAESWKEDAANKTITMKLRQGITFHDGTAFNAEAVKWNMDLNITQSKRGFGFVTSVDVIDEYTIKINFKQWDNTFLNNLTSFQGTQISPEAYKKNGEEWAIKNPVGTGPFKFVSWQRDANKVFERYDNYWQEGKPYLDKIEFIIIADPTVQIAAFMKKEGNLVTNISLKDAADLKNNKEYAIIQQSIGGHWHGLYPESINPDSPFNNLKVRQATAYAIDRETINDSILRGLGCPTNQLTGTT